MTQGIFVLAASVGTTVLLASLLTFMLEWPRLSHRFLIPAFGGPALPIRVLLIDSQLGIGSRALHFPSMMVNYLALVLVLGVPASFLMLHLCDFLKERMSK